MLHVISEFFNLSNLDNCKDEEEIDLQGVCVWWLMGCDQKLGFWYVDLIILLDIQGEMPSN